jgi:hypothetical protein
VGLAGSLIKWIARLNWGQHQQVKSGCPATFTEKLSSSHTHDIDVVRVPGRFSKKLALRIYGKEVYPIAIANWLLEWLVIPSLFYLLYLNLNSDGPIDLFHEGEFLVPLNELLRGGIPYRDIYLQHGLFHNALIPRLGAFLFEPTLLGVRLIRSYLEPLGYLSYYYLVLVTCRTRILPTLFIAFAGCGLLEDVMRRFGSERAFFGILSISVLAAAITAESGHPIMNFSCIQSEHRPGLKGVVRLCFHRGWKLIIAGFLAVLAFWHSVDIGIYALVTGFSFITLASLFRPNISIKFGILPLICYLGGVIMGFIPIAGYLVFLGAFDDFLRNTWIQCAYQSETWGIPFPSIYSAFGPIAATKNWIGWGNWIIGSSVQFYYCPIMTTAAVVVLAYQMMGSGFWSSRTAPTLLLLTIASMTFFRTMLGRSDKWHLFNGVMFAFVIALFLTDQCFIAAWGRFSNRGVSIIRRLIILPRLVTAVASAAGLYYLIVLFQTLPAFEIRSERFGRWPPITKGKEESVPRGGLTILPAIQSQQIRHAVEYIRTNSSENERVFDFSNQAAILFFADRRPLNRYFQLAYASTNDIQHETVADLERLRPSIVIFSGARDYKTGTDFDRIDDISSSNRHPLIANYLKTNYEFSAALGDVVFWKRKPLQLIGPQY